jgi:maleamate amidohydrolase
VTASAELEQRFHALRADYAAKGLGRPVGMGQHPAVVVVDLTNGFTDPGFPLGADLDAQVAATKQLLDVARAVGVPIIFLTIMFEPDGSDGGPFMAKAPTLQRLELGSVWGDIDARLERRESEPIVLKKVSSGFINTDLKEQLLALGVDTVLVTGASTSGCVRATAVDACSHGFRTTVVLDCVGDRSIDQHWANLIDLDSKYADVRDLDVVLHHLAALGTAQASTRS